MLRVLFDKSYHNAVRHVMQPFREIIFFEMSYILFIPFLVLERRNWKAYNAVIAQLR